MAHNIKLFTVKGMISICLTLTLTYLLITSNENINIFLPVYMVIINYLYGEKTGDADK